MSEDRQDDSTRNGDNSGELAKEVHWIQHATFWSQIVLGLIGIAALCIYYGQLKEMQKSTDAAVIAANASKKSADTADAALKHITANDKATSEASFSTFKQEERAYVGTTSANQSGDNGVLRDARGNHYCVDIHIANSGRTPAIGTRITRYVIVYGPEGKSIVGKMLVPSFPENGRVDPPNAPFFASACTPDPVDDTTLAKFQSATFGVYVYGVIQYRDIFGDYHETGFCLQRLPGFAVFGSPDFGNWFDKKPDRKN